MRGPVASARAEQIGVEPDFVEDVTGDVARLGLLFALDEWPECHRIADRHARVERRVGVLKHHLDLPAQRVDGEPLRRADGVPVENQFAGIGDNQVEEQPGEGRLAATRLADDAEGLALAHGERDAVDSLHRLAACALDREMLAQVARNQQRLQWSAAVARIGSESL